MGMEGSLAQRHVMTETIRMGLGALMTVYLQGLGSTARVGPLLPQRFAHSTVEMGSLKRGRRVRIVIMWQEMDAAFLASLSQVGCALRLMLLLWTVLRSVEMTIK